MEGRWMDSFKGQHVTVLMPVGGEERTETGTVINIEDGWVQLSKDNGDAVLIPVAAIRMMKLLDFTHSIPTAARDSAPTISSAIYEPNAQTI